MSIAGAGLLAGTVLRGMHQVVAGVKFGPVDTIFAASAVFIIMGGLVMISPLSDAARSWSAASSQDARIPACRANPA